MTGRKLIARIKRLGRRRGIPVRFEHKRGKGSHGTLSYGNRRTIVPDPRRELQPGT